MPHIQPSVRPRLLAVSCESLSSPRARLARAKRELSNSSPLPRPMREPAFFRSRWWRSMRFESRSISSWMARSELSSPLGTDGWPALTTASAFSR
jgi:hypothetical protein